MTVELDGLAVHGIDASGPGVLWLHGYSMSSQVWRPLWGRLPGWRHVGLDLPWHGGSRDLRADEDLGVLADVVVGHARALGLEHVVGMSLGAVLTLEIALRHPDAFRTWTLSAASVLGQPVDPDVERLYEKLWSLYRQHGPGPHMTRLWLGGPPDLFTSVLARPAIRDVVLPVVDAHSWRELAGPGTLRLTRRAQDVRGLRRVTAPVLVVTGEHELPAHRAAAAMIHEAAPAGRACVLAGCGHLALLEKPAAVTGLLTEHWGNARTSAPVTR